MYFFGKKSEKMKVRTVFWVFIKFSNMILNYIRIFLKKNQEKVKNYQGGP